MTFNIAYYIIICIICVYMYLCMYGCVCMYFSHLAQMFVNGEFSLGGKRKGTPVPTAQEWWWNQCTLQRRVVSIMKGHICVKLFWSLYNIEDTSYQVNYIVRPVYLFEISLPAKIIIRPREFGYWQGVVTRSYSLQCQMVH